MSKKLVALKIKEKPGTIPFPPAVAGSWKKTITPPNYRYTP